MSASERFSVAQEHKPTVLTNLQTEHQDTLCIERGNQEASRAVS